ncbi:alpha/beta hydrolase [Desulfosporosinus sp. PR]|uniref:alpha/beta fold hydrolase n=1 Tax=Candidatus Desulfosporosinus nitrosoreducens TaxID=3401928 RepID=UPI0027E8A937|nr:alpha/beta hydrolase [Desulfosporosinus sp. PR]MDQ7096423.1 alpha/beta hydrolase [Desulfosporosinus sp. PR]
MPYLSVKGTKTFYLCTSGKSGNFLPVVLIHGAGGSSQRWSGQFSNWQNQETLFAVDLPGHGNSEGALLKDIGSMAEFIADFAQALALETFILGGHSMGGAVAQEFTLRYPEKVKGLILIGTGARLRVAQSILDALAAGKMPFKDVNHLYGSATPDEQKAGEMKELEKISPEVFWADFHACNEFDRVGDAEKIQVPSLILVGDEDVMTPVKYAQFLASKLPGADLKVIGSAGHMCMEEKAAEVAEEIRSFLNQFRISASGANV